MRIGYCSPFNPMRSGISDFSEELVPALRSYGEIVIFSAQKLSNKEVSDHYECHLLSELHDDGLRNSLDIIVYHIGNNAEYHEEIVDLLQLYPGIVELHEPGLHDLAAKLFLQKKGKKAYLELVRYCHGENGVKIAEDFFGGSGRTPWGEYPLELSMNRYIIEAATGIIVHSEMAKQMVLGVCPNIPIVNIMLHTQIVDGELNRWKKTCRERLQLPQKKLIIGSFGFASKTKRILPVLDALQIYKEQDKTDFLFLLVGQTEKELNLKEIITEKNLSSNVFITGFTSLDDFNCYIGACDFCLNLRYPTQGENSGSLHRMMGMGKASIVTDIGAFSDYPDDTVIKVRYDENEVTDIYEAVSFLSSNLKEREKRGKASRDFAQKYCDINKNAKKYVDFFEHVKNQTWRKDEEDRMIERLCDCDLTEKGYLCHLWERCFLQQ